MELNLNGYTDLPAGRIAAIVTYLEMTSPRSCAPGAAPQGCTLERQQAVDPEAYRALFRSVGEPWLWFSRLAMSDGELQTALSGPHSDLWYLMRDGRPEGLLETDSSAWPDVEIAFLGVTPALVGQGAGRWLLRRGLELIWQRGARRVWLHTCTLDHPAALPFYLKQGFRAYHRAIEVAVDPRLAGLLPREAAPAIPLIEP